VWLTRRGSPILFSAAQRLSEVQVVAGAAGERFFLTNGTPGWAGRDAGGCLNTLVSDQFNSVVSSVMTGPDVMVSLGMLGLEAHPAKRNAAPTMIVADLNTRSLCGWANRTQAVSSFTICD